ncbi:MAG: glycosyltransferase family 4 protein [Candidatus Shapirobacteria bacterium]|nr:glycosyltransferase family 4 protein [Candidatus Shapirobacteria bacterium]
MQKRVAIYDPYLDTLGGGERYCLTIAEILLKKGYKVDLFWSGNKSLVEKAEKRFSLDLTNIKIVPDIFEIKPQRLELIEESRIFSKFINHAINPQKIHFKFKKLFKKLKTTNKYEIIFYLSDGSVPFLFGKKNYLHIQVPFVQTPSYLKNVLNQPKLKLISNVICNSQFTSKFQIGALKNKALVLYPPVDVDKFKVSHQKENIILSVGRFDNILNAKKQDVLIDAFKNLVDKNGVRDWKLVLVGGSLIDPEKNLYLKYLYEKAKDLSVNFVVNPQFNDLQKIYSESKIYWHAAGFEVNQDIHPENTEHFGITIVEAMASGLVPVVIAKGGIPEIIENGVNGFLWNSLDELVLKTKKLIENPENLKLMSQQSIINCRAFSKENFEKRLLAIIED